MQSETGGFHASCCYAGCSCNLFIIIIELDEQADPEFSVIEVWMVFFKDGEKVCVCFCEFDLDPLCQSGSVKEALTNGGHRFFGSGLDSKGVDLVKKRLQEKLIGGVQCCCPAQFPFICCDCCFEIGYNLLLFRG